MNILNITMFQVLEGGQCVVSGLLDFRETNLRSDVCNQQYERLRDVPDQMRALMTCLN